MQDKLLYEYAVLRLVPKLEREEFINVGLMLFCKRKRYLRLEFDIPYQKVKLFCSEFDIDQAQINLQSFKNIAQGKKDSGPIALLEVDERFRWIGAVKSSSIQFSRPHPGYTYDLDATFEKLYLELVK